MSKKAGFKCRSFLDKFNKGEIAYYLRSKQWLGPMTLAPTPTKQYVEQRDKGYWIEGTRISLDSVLYSFLNGDSPESIAQNFSLLSLEQVYGGITFYLANRELVDAYLAEGEVEFERLQQSCKQKSPLLYQKLKAFQAQKQSAA